MCSLEISLKSLHTKNSSLLRYFLLNLNGLILPVPCIPYAGVCWCLFLLLKVQMSKDYALSLCKSESSSSGFACVLVLLFEDYHFPFLLLS